MFELKENSMNVTNARQVRESVALLNLTCCSRSRFILSVLFQIMEVNGQNFENISFSKAVDILRNNTHLSITVKTNIFGEKSCVLFERVSQTKITSNNARNVTRARFWETNQPLFFHPSSLQRAP